MISRRMTKSQGHGEGWQKDGLENEINFDGGTFCHVYSRLEGGGAGGKTA